MINNEPAVTLYTRSWSTKPIVYGFTLRPDDLINYKGVQYVVLRVNHNIDTNTLEVAIEIDDRDH